MIYSKRTHTASVDLLVVYWANELIYCRREQIRRKKQFVYVVLVAVLICLVVLVRACAYNRNQPLPMPARSGGGGGGGGNGVMFANPKEKRFLKMLNV